MLGRSPLVATGVLVAEAGEIVDGEFDQAAEGGVFTVGQDQRGALIELVDDRRGAIEQVGDGSLMGAGTVAGLLKLSVEAIDGGAEPRSVIGVERDLLAIDLNDLVFD